MSRIDGSRRSEMSRHVPDRWTASIRDVLPCLGAEDRFGRGPPSMSRIGGSRRSGMSRDLSDRCIASITDVPGHERPGICGYFTSGRGVVGVTMPEALATRVGHAPEHAEGVSTGGPRPPTGSDPLATRVRGRQRAPIPCRQGSEAASGLRPLVDTGSRPPTGAEVRAAAGPSRSAGALLDVRAAFSAQSAPRFTVPRPPETVSELTGRVARAGGNRGFSGSLASLAVLLLSVLRQPLTRAVPSLWPDQADLAPQM